MTMDLHALAAPFVSGAAGVAVAGFVLKGILQQYVPSYLAEKGKNLATKEDIGAITRAVEGVKDEFARQQQEITHQNRLALQAQEQHHRLSVAALDDRLRVHQEAYRLWWDLRSKVH